MSEAIKDFRVRREEVIDYIKDRLEEQGVNKSNRIWETTRIFFWSSRDVNNLHKCINSDLPEEVKASIVAHDFNGLSKKDDCFVPKSLQFGRA